MPAIADRLENGMLKDGSNPENVDPAPPLSWQRSDFTNVTLYGSWASPPTNKIKCYLISNNIPFNYINSSKKGSDYKKVPVLEVAGRQVNDSFIILKNLIPALTGSFDEDFEKKVTYCFNNSLLVEMDSKDYTSYLREPAGPGLGLPNCILSCASPVLTPKVFRPFSAKTFDTIEGAHRIDTLEFLKEFAAGMAGKDFYGGSEPGQRDLSIFGHVSILKYKKVPHVLHLLEQAGLEAWAERMSKLIPGEKLAPPLYK